MTADDKRWFLASGGGGSGKKEAGSKVEGVKKKKKAKARRTSLNQKWQEVRISKTCTGWAGDLTLAICRASAWPTAEQAEDARTKSCPWKLWQ